MHGLYPLIGLSSTDVDFRSWIISAFVKSAKIKLCCLHLLSRESLYLACDLVTIFRFVTSHI